MNHATPRELLARRVLRHAAFLLPALLLAAGLSTLAPAQAAYQQGITPGSLEAYVFTTYPNFVIGDVPYGYPQELARLLIGQGYNVAVREDYNGPGNDNPGTATAREFKKAAGAGVVVFWVHGDSSSLVVEEYQTPAVRDKALEVYLATAEFQSTDIESCFSGNAPNIFPAICLTAAGIQTLWAGKNRDALVFAGACSSAGLADEFGVRDYFGYSCPVSGSDIISDSNKILGRMSGTLANGNLRTAEEAFDGGNGYSTDLTLAQPSPVPILLAPGVWNHLPTTDLLAPKAGEPPIEYGALITFDAAMDTSKVPIRIVSRCAEYVADTGWDALGHHFSFKIKVSPTPIADFIRFESTPDAAQSHNIHQALDGNQIPTSSNRVGPAGDPFEWTIQCLPPVAACEDGIDNDGDGSTDHPNDPGCSSPSDNDEVDPGATVGGFVLPIDPARGAHVRTQALALLPLVVACGFAVWLRSRGQSP